MAPMTDDLREYRIGVIVKVPGEGERGNMYDEVVMYRDQMISVELPCFYLGEILILDRYGREVAGLGRKPSKWLVECQEFPATELDKAIALAKSLRAW